jgi:hypothetical protein
MGPNLRRYALWQFRDFGRERGIALILVGFLIGLAVVGPMRAMGRPIDQRMASMLLTAAVTQVAFIAAFIALNGIVSNDRKLGYFRFLFSKPVSIPAFYSQLFVIYFIGYLVVCALLLGAFSIFAHPVSPLAPLAYCALTFLSLGGIAFLISTLFRVDWPVLAAIFLGSAILHGMWRYEEGWRRLVLYVLPPLYRLPQILPDMVDRGTADSRDVAWLLGYSAVCFAVGLIVLRRRPFA